MWVCMQVWAALSQPSVYLPLAFLFVWQGTPSSESAFFYFRTSHTHHTSYMIFHPSQEYTAPTPLPCLSPDLPPFLCPPSDE